MKTDESMYRFVIMMDDLKVGEVQRSFENNADLIDYVTNFLNGNNQYDIQVYNGKNEKIYELSYEVGSHNEMKLFDKNNFKFM